MTIDDNSRTKFALVKILLTLRGNPLPTLENHGCRNMNSDDLNRPGSPYLRRPTRSLELVLAERAGIPCPTDEAAELRKSVSESNRPKKSDGG